MNNTKNPMDIQPIKIANAKIGFRNFSGKEGQFNPAGNRNFAVFIDDIDLARRMEQDGWNIRWLKAKDEGDNDQPMISVKVAFGKIPPKIVLVSRKGLSKLGEDEINILDWAEIANVDLTIRPYTWSVSGKSGVKAYLKTMYITIVEDDWENKYVERPDSAQDAIGGCGNCEICDGHCGSPEAL